MILSSDNDKRVSLSQIYKIMREKLNLTNKKVVKVAFYRTKVYVQVARKKFRENIRLFHPYSLVYIDESHFDTFDTCRDRGWATVGSVVQTTKHKPSNRTWSLLCAITAFGVVYHELIETQKTSIKGEKFKKFLGNLLELVPDTAVILMDNASIHHIDDVENLFNFWGMEYIYTSPYSPDYNPIEYYFGWIKKRCKALEYDKLPDAVNAAIDDTTPELLKSFIKHVSKNWESNAL